MNGAQKATLAPEYDGDVAAVPVLGVLAGSEAYAVPLATVREILVPPPLTEVPRSEDHFLGVISVRGEIVTVIDLPKLLQLEINNSDPYGRVLLIDTGEELVGVAVDRVTQVHRLHPKQIEYASTMGTDLSDYVVGIGRVPSETGDDEDQMLILIDPVGLLGD